MSKPPKNTKDKTKDKSRYAKDIKIATSNLFVDISKVPVYANIDELILEELNLSLIHI
jgi:hypothetical protein